jgi:hypothetical protein
MAASTATASSALSMKLLVDTKAQRVLFAEAGKDAVDFLFSLLALPVGTTVKLLGKKSMVGCVGNLYASVEKLDGTYVQPGAAKDALLRPTVVSPAASSLLLPQPSSGQPKGLFKCGYNPSCSYVSDTSGTECPSCWGAMTTAVQIVPSASKVFYRCRSCSSSDSYVSDSSSTKCPTCYNIMTWTVQFVPSPAASEGQVASQEATVGGAKGFVQGIVTYTVMDDLTVTPMSSISSIALLNTFAVKDIGALQEKTVQLGYKEVHKDIFVFSYFLKHQYINSAKLQFAGFGDTEGVAAVQDGPHRRLPWEEDHHLRMKARLCI